MRKGKNQNKGAPSRAQAAPIPQPHTFVDQSAHPIQSQQTKIAVSYAQSTLLPDAMTIAKYEEILPGAAERILALTERQALHRQSLEEAESKASIDALKKQHKLAEFESNAIAESMRKDFSEARIGQFCALGIGAFAFICGTYTAVNGAEIAGALIGSSGVAGLVTAFIAGRSMQAKKNNSDTAEPDPEK